MDGPAFRVPPAVNGDPGEFPLLGGDVLAAASTGGKAGVGVSGSHSQPPQVKQVEKWVCPLTGLRLRPQRRIPQIEQRGAWVSSAGGGSGCWPAAAGAGAAAGGPTGAAAGGPDAVQPPGFNGSTPASPEVVRSSPGGKASRRGSSRLAVPQCLSASSLHSRIINAPGRRGAVSAGMRWAMLRRHRGR